VDAGYFVGNRFFRAIPGFMVQWGIHGTPEIAQKWRAMPITDDPVTESNVPYTLSFATSGKNARSSQIFINTVDNDRLDELGFAPFAKVVGGYDTVDDIYDAHGESPQQVKIYEHGNTWLKKKFPKLSYITATKKRGKGPGYPADYAAPDAPADLVNAADIAAKAAAAKRAAKAAGEGL